MSKDAFLFPHFPTFKFLLMTSPIGATFYQNGVNFCIYSKSATACDLLLFNHKNDKIPSQIIRLQSTNHYWHIFINDLENGQLYGYRFYGENNPEKGLLFDDEKLLLDPYAKSIVLSDNFSRGKAILKGNNFGEAMKSVVVNLGNYDWENDQPLHKPYSKTVIYELHLAGFTKNPNAKTKAKRGTYSALIEKIPYLKSLGITAVELLPIHQFDACDLPRHSEAEFQHLRNYWGYSTVGFFAPHQGFATSDKPQNVVNEFRDMVKAFHKAGIEVILDVVYNHSAEGKEGNALYNFRGIDNETYYILEENNKAKYKNYSGCGNTLKAENPIVEQLILDSLKYWVTEMHIDGFRFDLAAILARDSNGNPLEKAPILEKIKTDPILAATKIIAEPWDAAGLYKVGEFTDGKWAEWNDKFRDDIRSFVRGDKGQIGNLAARITGSADILWKHAEAKKNCNPNHSINFFSCHDGFTLNDLVSYTQKNNIANGEKNRDGSNHNISANYGEEGISQNSEIEKRRLQQIKNFFVLLFISHGTPMISMGDEVRRTQNGNNNVYCQDNPLAWFDWELLEKNKDLFQFVQKLIRMNLAFSVFRSEKLWNDSPPYDFSENHIRWSGAKLYQPDWSENAQTLAFTLYDASARKSFHIFLNAAAEPQEFEFPLLSASHWERIVDTSLDFPYDFHSEKLATSENENRYKVNGNSMVILLEN